MGGVVGEVHGQSGGSGRRERHSGPATTLGCRPWPFGVCPWWVTDRAVLARAAAPPRPAVSGGRLAWAVVIEMSAGTPPKLMRVLAVAVAVAQAAIAVTGSVVRVTGSGLGCPTWPPCFPDSLVPDPRYDVAAIHQWVEFGNRMLTVVVSVVAIAALVAA